MFLLILGIVLFVLGMSARNADSPLHRLRSVLRLGGIVLAVVGFFTAAVVQIPAGHVGVKVLFGKVEEGVLYEGLNVINPLLKVVEMEMRTRNYTMSSVHDEGQQQGEDGIRVLSKDGLEVLLDLTILYKVIPEKAPSLYRDLSSDFEQRYIRAIARTRIRESAANYVATDLYSFRRKEFEMSINSSMMENFRDKGLVLEQLLVRNLTLPNSVKQSIEQKITAEQDAQRMEYVLQKGHQEAELRRVEAKGVADAQKILSEGLSEKVLQYEMIKVQKELVNSQNSKIIVLGKMGAPLMLNTGN